MIKYLNKYLTEESFGIPLDILYFRGATIERVAAKISALKPRYDWILVHVGTNNVSLDSVEVIHTKYKALVNEFVLKYPDAQIILSGVIPRSSNLFRQDCRQSINHLDVLNYKIEAINNRLKKLCFDGEALFFCSTYKTSWARFLGYDGLHLNFMGNQLLGHMLVEAFKACRSSRVALKKVRIHEVN